MIFRPLNLLLSAISVGTLPDLIFLFEPCLEKERKSSIWMNDDHAPQKYVLRKIIKEILKKRSAYQVKDCISLLIFVDSFLNICQSNGFHTISLSEENMKIHVTSSTQTIPCACLKQLAHNASIGHCG